MSFLVRWRPYCHIGIHTKAWVQTARSEYGRQHHFPICFGIDKLHRPPSCWMDLPEKDGLPPYPSLPWSPWVFSLSHSIPLHHQLLVDGSRSGNSRCRTGLVTTIQFSSFNFFNRSLSKHLLNRRLVHNVYYTFWKEGTWEKIVFSLISLIMWGHSNLSMTNVKFSQPRFWTCGETGLLKTIPTIPTAYVLISYQASL